MVLNGFFYLYIHVYMYIFEVSAYLPSLVNDVVAKFTSQSTADRADAKVIEFAQFSQKIFVQLAECV